MLTGLAGEDGLVGIGDGEGVSIPDVVAGVERGPRSPGPGRWPRWFAG
jgi:hypothetical protein